MLRSSDPDLDLSFPVFELQIFLVFVAVFGIIIYRSVMENMLNRHSKAFKEDANSPLQNPSPLLSSKAVASATASVVNLICIWLLSFVS